MRQRRDSSSRGPVRIRQVELNEPQQRFSPDRRHNTELVILTYVFAAMFLLLIGYLVYINVFKADELRSNPNNTKKDSSSSNIIRGSIVTEDGVVLATTNIDGDGGKPARTRMRIFSPMSSVTRPTANPDWRRRRTTNC